MKHTLEATLASMQSRMAPAFVDGFDDVVLGSHRGYRPEALPFEHYQPGEDGDGDCGLRALTKVLDVSYDEAARLVIEVQRDDNLLPDGANDEAYLAAIKAHGIKTSHLSKVLRATGFKVIVPNWDDRSERRRAIFRPELLPAGPVLVILRKHAVAVVDNAIYDSVPSARTGRRNIRSYWVPADSEETAADYWDRHEEDRRTRRGVKVIHGKDKPVRHKVDYRWSQDKVTRVYSIEHKTFTDLVMRIEKLDKLVASAAAGDTRLRWQLTIPRTEAAGGTLVTHHRTMKDAKFAAHEWLVEQTGSDYYAEI